MVRVKIHRDRQAHKLLEAPGNSKSKSKSKKTVQEREREDKKNFLTFKTD